mgnify:CR=1 FL=1
MARETAVAVEAATVTLRVAAAGRTWVAAVAADYPANSSVPAPMSVGQWQRLSPRILPLSTRQRFRWSCAATALGLA